jgi:hypothetical protein
MGKIYNRQTALRIQVDCGIDLSTALVKEIWVKKPGGSVMHWTATLSTLSNNICYYDIKEEAELDEVGYYYVQAYVQFADERKAFGEETRFEVCQSPVVP